MDDSRIRCIFFDLGNVLISLDAVKFGEKMESLTGLQPDQLLPAFMDNLVLDYECGRLDDHAFLEGLSRRVGVPITREKLDEAWTCMFREVPLIPGQLLEELARNFRLWVVSNTNRMHFEYILKHYSFLKHFCGWSLSYEVGAAKPDPAIFAHALANTGIAPSEALFIDDQLINVESARKMKMDAIQFHDAAQLIEVFREKNIIANYER
jgi:glucose-1-phosphatase